MTPASLKETALRTLAMEQEAVAALAGRIDETFVAACELILNSQGRVIVMGMGKSGHIANKIAATLASTGTPAFFVHPAEASHGDIGMVTEQDLVLAVSHSGSTPELENLLPVLKRKAIPLISLTGNPDSALARQATLSLDASVSREACPLGLAPTTSTTAALALGDAIAMALLEARGFTAEDFAFSHPGGNLGRRLLLKVGDIAHGGEDMPRVREDLSVSDSLLEMSAKKLGMTTVVNAAGEVTGVFTDGDLRRFLDKGGDIRRTPISAEMTADFKSISANALASEAAKFMQDHEIYSLVAADEDGVPCGIVTMHDLLKANVV